MKLVSYIKEGHEQLAILVNSFLYDTDRLHPELPSTMSMFLNYWDDYLPVARAINDSIHEGRISLNKGVPFESVQLLAPVPQPASCRKQLLPVENAGSVNFHFINHHNVQGSGELPCMPDTLVNLQAAFHLAAVICRNGRNITIGEAADYIGGYIFAATISSGTQPGEREKNVATILGPILFTEDEMETVINANTQEPEPCNFELVLRTRIKGDENVDSSATNVRCDFNRFVESCSYGAELYPGDIILCGNKDEGLLMQSSPDSDPNVTMEPRKLNAGDTVEFDIENLGTLTFSITAEESDYSLMR